MEQGERRGTGSTPHTSARRAAPVELEAAVHSLGAGGAGAGEAHAVRVAVRKALIERGMTQKELAARVGMSEAVLSHFLNARRQKLTGAERRAIARELGLRPGLGLGERRADGGIVTKRLRLVPVYPIGAGYEIAFGDGDTPVGESLEEPVFTDVPDPNAFAGKIVGSSMEAPEEKGGFREGDVVVFDTKAEVRSGCFCLVRLADGASTFKQVFREGDTVRLHPLNPEFADDVRSVADVHAMYRAVRHIRKI